MTSLMTAATPPNDLTGLRNTPVAPAGVVAPINQILGVATFLALALAALALIAVFAQLIMSALGRGGDGAERLVRNLIKVFGGAVGASMALALLTLVTGGF